MEHISVSTRKKAILAEKRAEALRANLKKRKEQASARDNDRDNDSNSDKNKTHATTEEI